MWLFSFCSFLFRNTIGQWVWHWVSNNTTNNSSNGFCLVSVRVFIFFIYSPNKRGFNTDLYFSLLDTLLDQTPYTLITSIGWLLPHRFIHFMHSIIHSFRFTKFVYTKCLRFELVLWCVRVVCAVVKICLEFVFICEFVSFPLVFTSSNCSLFRWEQDRRNEI